MQHNDETILPTSTGYQTAQALHLIRTNVLARRIKTSFSAKIMITSGIQEELVPGAPKA
jgi:hypothetical protein